MNLAQTQYNVKKIVNYTESIKSFLNFYNGDEKIGDNDDNTLGGVLSDVNYTWLSNGSKLVVLNTVSGVKLAAWNFGAVLRDSFTRITCVVGLQSANGRAPLLIVGLQSGHTRGMICIFDITSSKVIRAIQIEKSVTSVHVIDDGCGPNLPGVLHPLDGILAVGTVEGRVLLIDLCRQALDEAVIGLNMEYIRDEITACDVLPLTTYDIPLLEHHKEVAIRNSQHICIQINEINSTSYFTLKEPSGKILIRANIVEVKVSALYFCPQLGSLLVGFNFGAIQIYNLLLVKLNYTHLHESITPVSHFAFQEPCDDPRAFCYLWVVYSNIEKVENENVENFPLAVMYAISCNTKDFLEGYGTLYQEILSFSNRFQTHLKSLPFSHIRNPTSGHCISLKAYTKGIVKQNNSVQDIVEDRIALCVVVWSVTNDTHTETFMGLFDLNQWYKEQMPTSVKFNDNPESYILFMSISDLLNTSKGSIIDVKIDSKTIMQFNAAQRLEEHYFPSSLTFKLICTRVDDIVWIHCPGVQRYILSRIDLAGPLCLLRPTEIFLNCLTFGLTPLFSDTLYNESTPVNIQREMILSIALEHQLISWLCQCAQEWSNGSQSSSGCTLEFLLSWAWQRANILKTNAIDLCKCLFDHSGMRLDSNAHILFNHSTRQIKNLVSFYSNIIHNCSRYLYNNDYHEIQQQHKTLQLISVYFEVLQWLLNVGLLPECPLHMYPRLNEPDRISAPYPVDSLVRFYQDRRDILFELQGERQLEPTKSCDLLFIDNLIDLQCNGKVLHTEWQQDGGTGLYPPPSLQSCLRTYLIDNVDIVYKHSIFIYLFLDLAMTLDQNHYSHVITHLIKFPAVFKLSPSIIKITQAFWQLDHGDFSTAMSQLLDPLVSNEDLHQWHHRVAVKSLLAQGQHQHALLYHQVRKPPMLDLQDLCITITLLIVNDLLQEAFHFQRQHRSDGNEKELLQHFMEACDKTNQLVNILQLPLSEVEEQALMKYLEVNRREDTENLMVIYYLHRSRYAEALNNNEKLNTKVKITQGLIGQQNLNFRNEIITDYREKLPSVTKKLLDFCKSKENLSTWKNISKPHPMSVYVHDSQEKTKYKSSLIQSSLQRIKEAWNQPNSKILPFISTPKLIQSRRSYLSTPKIYPTIIQASLDDDDGPTPNKIRRISPRQPIGNFGKESEESERPQRRVIVSASSLLSTPIVKRKVVRHTVSARKTFEELNIGTPQSILKVRKLMKRSTSPVRRGESTTPENLDEIENDLPEVDKNSADMIKSSYINLANYNISTPTITPRKSVERTPKQGVRFVDLRPSSTSSDGTIENEDYVSKNTTLSDDVFYSPDMKNKPSDSNKTIENEKEIPITIEMADENNSETDRLFLLQTPTTPSSRKRKHNDSTIKARKSYKADLSNNSVVSPFSLSSLESSPVTPQSAPVKNTPAIITESPAVSTEAHSGESSVMSDTPTKRFPKVSSRKSLTRKVLEQNTIAKVLSTPRMQTRLSQAKLSENKNAVGVEITHTEKMTSFVREVGDKTIEESKTEANMEVKNTFSTETDPVTLEQTIKHQHNESFNKSSTKLTEEVLEDSISDLSGIDPVLTSDSDVDESVLMKYYNDKETSNVISNESIFSIDESLDNEYDTQDDLIEEFSIVEEQREEEKKPEEAVENQTTGGNVEPEPFEITDDLSDEDVEFNFQSTHEIQNVENENAEDVVEMQDVEPENYIEPDFEEEVGNMLSEDSNVDDNNKDTGYTDGDIQIEVANENSSDIEKYAQEVIEEQEDSEEERAEKYSDEDDRDQNEEVSDEEIEVGRVDYEEEEEGDDEDEGDEEESEEEKVSNTDSDSNPANQVIQIDSSSEDDMELKLSQEENSSSDFEKNITNFESESECNESNKHKNDNRIEASDSQCSLDSKASTLIRVSEEKDDIEEYERETSEVPEIEVTVNEDEQLENVEENTPQTEIQEETIIVERKIETVEEISNGEEEGTQIIQTEEIIEQREEIITEEINVEQTEDMETEVVQVETVVETEEITTTIEYEEEIEPTEQIEEIESTEKVVESMELETAETVVESSEKTVEPSEKLKQSEEMVQQSEEMPQQSEEMAQQSEEMVQQSEEMAQQSEEIPQQSEEMAQQSEEMTQQSEEIAEPLETKTESPEDKSVLKEDKSNTKEEKSVSKEDISETTEPKSVSTEESDQQNESKPQKLTSRRGRSSSVQKDDEALEKVPKKRGRKPSTQIEVIEERKESPTPSKPNEEESSKNEESQDSVPKRKTRRQSVLEEEQSDVASPGRITRNRGLQDSDSSTPGKKEKKTEEKTPGRVTRRTSVQPEDVEVPTRRTRQGSVQSEEVEVPTRRTRQGSVQPEEPATPSRRTRQGSVQPEDIDTPARRTRRTSVQPEDIDTPSRRTRQGSVQPEDVDTPRRRTRQSSVQSEDPGTPIRRTRQGSVQPEEPETPSRRTRQRSVQPEEPETSRTTRQGSIQRETTPARITRRSSIQSEDIEVTPSQNLETDVVKPKRGRPRSVKSVEIDKTKSGPSSVISDDAPSTPTRLRLKKGTEGTPSTPVLETIEEYASTHRLTRRQKDIIEKTMKIQEMKKLESTDQVQSMEEENQEEPDEIIQHSPASSVRTESSVGTRSSTRLRESSQGSTPKRVNVQESPGKESEDEGKGKRRSFTMAQQALSSPHLVKKRRLSNTSDTSEGSSIVSMPMVVLKKFDPVEMEKLRHRSLSPTLLEKDENTSSKLKVKRKGRTSILPPIVESSNVTDESGTSEIKNPSPPKRGRPKKR